MQEPNPLLRCRESEQPTQGLARPCLLGSFLQGPPSNLAVGLQQQPSAHQPHACPAPSQQDSTATSHGPAFSGKPPSGQILILRPLSLFGGPVSMCHLCPTAVTEFPIPSFIAESGAGVQGATSGSAKNSAKLRWQARGRSDGPPSATSQNEALIRTCAFPAPRGRAPPVSPSFRLRITTCSSRAAPLAQVDDITPTKKPSDHGCREPGPNMPWSHLLRSEV